MPEGTLCPICAFDEFDEVIVDGTRWAFAKGLLNAAMRFMRSGVTQHMQSFRCRKCGNVQSFARK